MSRKIIILALLVVLTGLGLLTNCVRQKNEEAVKNQLNKKGEYLRSPQNLLRKVTIIN